MLEISDLFQFLTEFIIDRISSEKANETEGNDDDANSDNDHRDSDSDYESDGNEEWPYMRGEETA
jgi:hypothetical protein